MWKWMVPVCLSWRRKTEGRMGKIEGQSARTREAKLGCVFTQTSTDDQGRPVRDEDSTTYTGAIETAELFGRRLYAEAHHRGWNRAKRKVVIVMGPSGSGILPMNTSRPRSKLWISIMPVNTCGS